MKHGARTRPLGRLTRRPLPERDPSLDGLADDVRAGVIATWAGRAEAELRTAGSFAFIVNTLLDLESPRDLVELARRAVNDEERHSEICWRVAVAYNGSELAQPRRLRATVPAHDEAPAALRPTLHVFGQCCLNETTASAYLEACRADATGLARAALRELLTDEIDHARIGWAHLTLVASEPTLRGEISQWIVPLVETNLAAWARRADYSRAAEHGCPSREVGNRAILGALRTLIVPGFRQAGLDVTAAEQFARTVAVA